MICVLFFMPEAGSRELSDPGTSHTYGLNFSQQELEELQAAARV
jgi:hypothetical protein